MQAHEAVRTPTVDDEDGAREWLFIRPDETNDVTIEETEDGPTEITVPISSTTAHRSGSRMSESALEAMASQLRDETVGLWDDHGLDEYGWPEYRREDMYGWWVDGSVEDGVLMGTARLREGDERSADLIDQLDQGMPVGFSVGYIPLDEEWVEADDGDLEGEEERVIRDVDLLETSPVGIPDNPNAYADAAAGRVIARSIADAGVEVDRQTASIVADSVADALTHMDKHDEGGEDPPAYEEEAEQNDGGDGVETNQFSEEEVEEIMGIVGGAVESSINDAMDEIEERLQGEGDEGDDDGGDEEEEEAEGDKDGDEEEDEDEEESASAELAEIRSELATLREENEELRSTVDRLQSETRESQGRKGMAAPTEGADGGPEETSDGGEQGNTNDEDADDQRTALDEAFLMGN